MRFPDQHLNADEIELLAGEGDLSDELRSGLSEAREHVGVCEDCRQTVSAYRDMGSTMEILRNPGRAHKQPDCPPLDIWLQVAGGLLTPAENNKYLDHAAQCDYCGPVLREIHHDLTSPTTQEEQIKLGGVVDVTKLPTEVIELQTIQAKSRPRILAIKNRSEWIQNHFFWVTSAAAIIICILIGVRILYFRTNDEQNARALLAQAYTEQRTIELRIDDADYAALHVERGIERSHFSRPSALLDSEAIIGRRLKVQPDDAHWLQLKGEVEILDGRYSAAIHSLESAKEKDSNSDEVLIDLATAYFEYADADPDSREASYGNAIQLLSAVLQKNPNSKIALFNRAIAYAKVHCYEEAVTDWRRYLTIDSSSKWADEARQRLKDAEKKLDTFNEHVAELLLDSASIAKNMALDREQTVDIIDTKIEQVFEIVTSEWLGEVFPLKVSLKSPESRVNPASLHIIAEVLDERHHDTWLKEMLQTPRSAPLAAAVHDLQQAIKANSQGDPTTAEVSAKNAERNFGLAGNRAGQLRAQFERIHALQRSQDGRRCLNLAEQTETRLSSTNFSWIKTQVLMEEASCWGKLSNFAMSERFASAALVEAERYGFNDLKLRALAIAADIELSMGKPDSAWMHDLQGLNIFWKGSYSPVRGYSFYDNIEYIAESEGQWYLAVAAGNEGIHQIAMTANTAAEALSRYRLASDSIMVSNYDSAQSEFIRAKNLFRSLPQTRVNHVYSLYSQIFLDQLQHGSDQANHVIATLNKAHRELQDVSNYIIELDFYRVLASLYIANKRFDNAMRTSFEAVQIAERGLQSLPTASARLAWKNETAFVYRQFLQSYMNSGDDLHGGLAFWEWFRAIPLGRQRRKCTLHHGRLFTCIDIYKIPHLYTNTTFVSYAQLPTELIIWIFNEHKLQVVHVAASEDQLRRHVTEFVSLCGSPGSTIEQLRKESSWLYRVVFGPITSLLENNGSLVIEPDGILNRLPIDALLDPADHYIGERYVLTISYGLAFFKVDRPFSRQEVALIVNPPDSVSDGFDLPPLPGAEKEVTNVAAQFVRTVILKGVKATSINIQSAIKTSTVFHFVGHSIGVGKRTGLLVSADASSRSGYRIWDTHEIDHFHWRHLKLVVISSCSTNIENYSKRMNPDIIDIIIYKGAMHVIASGWEVDSEATAELMKTFYSYRLSGYGTSNALKMAQLQLRKNPIYSHPYYWAAFSQFGQP